MAAGVRILLMLGAVARAHEYMETPLARTDTCLLNGVIMGSKICDTITPGDDQQCLDDPLMFSHLFHVHKAYDGFACGGSTLVKGASGGSQGLLQNCGDMASDPRRFNMSMSDGPKATTFTAGGHVTLGLKGFFHQGVNRVSLCYLDDASSDCSSPSGFESYVLGFHFTEGTAGDESDPEGIYSVSLGFEVTMPRRTGRAVLQWLVDAEDVRSYVSCHVVEIVGAREHGVEIVGGGASGAEATPAPETARAKAEHAPSEYYTCNGHPLCNCTTSRAPVAGGVALGLTCPQGVAPSVAHGSATGTDVVAQWKAQLGVVEFCALCATNGCPSSCGGRYAGFYQGPKCTNAPVLPGCGVHHASGLPRFVECTPSSCVSAGWRPSPPGPPPPPAPPPPPPTPPTPDPPGKYCKGNACATGWVYKDNDCPADQPLVECWNTDDNYKCCAPTRG